MVPALDRLPEARRLIDREGYFVLHAPRQTGKTTTLLALAQALTGEGRYAAMHVSCEAAASAGDELDQAESILLSFVRSSAEIQLPSELLPPPWPDAPAGSRVAKCLEAWATRCPRPLVLFLDEVDALRGESLKSVLHQLRAGYPHRPTSFPASVVLCGLSDVRDYKAASGGDPGRLGTSSPFNIKVESLRLADFDFEDVRELYGQHTREQGQLFEEEAVGRAFELSQGQPWLVNAIAAEIVDKLEVSGPITSEHVELAKERLILARATHLDSLVARLTEPRIRRVIEPLLSGELTPVDPSYDDDVSYVRDLGLLARGPPLRIANPIYREVIVRMLALPLEDAVTLEPRSFILPTGELDFQGLLREFIEFWIANGDILTSRQNYHEVAPQLVFMAFLQRLINGGGYVDREYGVGRGRIDLLVRWPFRDAMGARVWQREAIELKVWRKEDPLEKGLAQLDGYLERLGLRVGTLVIFDRRAEAAKLAERTKITRVTSPAGREVTLLRA
ncbi:MAG: ATP-binding protein [Deltaproteobacteria bacterium]|nr:ATP-binding protein [Deltaproteobacteria bacterium]